MKRIIFLLFLVIFQASCASKPSGTTRIDFPTRSPVWLDEVAERALPAVKGRGYMVYPDGAGPFPAVIVLHTSLGLGTLEWDFAAAARQQGMAVFLVDSFEPRGVHKIVDDQTIVSEASIMTDLYEAHALLKRDHKIDDQRIAVAGFSKGGLPAFYTAFSSVHTLYGYASDPFAAHLAFYPWCGLTLYNQHLSGKPVQVHSGAADKVTPAALCENLVADVKMRNPGAPIDMYVYEGQGHAFNHPVLSSLPKLPVGYRVPKKCKIVQGADQAYIETSAGQVVTSASFSSVINGCSEKGASVNGDAEEAALANGRAMDFLVKTLKP